METEFKAYCKVFDKINEFKMAVNIIQYDDDFDVVPTMESICIANQILIAEMEKNEKTNFSKRIF